MKKLSLHVPLAIAMWPIEAAPNSCFAIKPTKISGALCGRVFDLTGAIVPNTRLRVFDTSGKVEAEKETDSRGDFLFANLPKGTYRLDADRSQGWQITFGGFQITHADSACRNPVTVDVGIMACSGGISKKRPKHY